MGDPFNILVQRQGALTSHDITFLNSFLCVQKPSAGGDLAKKDDHRDIHLLVVLGLKVARLSVTGYSRAPRY
jgi:hypothetical protein